MIMRAARRINLARGFTVTGTAADLPGNAKNEFRGGNAALVFVLPKRLVDLIIRLMKNSMKGALTIIVFLLIAK